MTNGSLTIESPGDWEIEQRRRLSGAWGDEQWNLSLRRTRMGSDYLYHVSRLPMSARDDPSPRERPGEVVRLPYRNLPLGFPFNRGAPFLLRYSTQTGVCVGPPKGRNTRTSTRQRRKLSKPPPS